MALRTRESARRHLVSRPCLPYPELVDLRAAFGVECEVAGSAGEQVGGGGVGEWHPCGLVDGEAIGAGPDVLCSRRIGGLDCFGLGDEAVELGVAESAAVGGAGRILGVVVRAGQEVAEELARGGESPRVLWRLPIHGRVGRWEQHGSIRTSCVTGRSGWCWTWSRTRTPA